MTTLTQEKMKMFMHYTQCSNIVRNLMNAEENCNFSF